MCLIGPSASIFACSSSGIRTGWITTSSPRSRTMVMLRGNSTPGAKRTVPHAHQMSSNTCSSVPNTGPGLDLNPPAPCRFCSPSCLLSVAIARESTLA
jgi:hypothetical protein